MTIKISGGTSIIIDEDELKSLRDFFSVRGRRNGCSQNTGLSRGTLINALDKGWCTLDSLTTIREYVAAFKQQTGQPTTA